MFLVLQGGQWVWPGVCRGYRRDISLGDGQNATLETLCLHPLVLSVNGFLTTEECDYIKRHADPDMRYSEVTLMDHDKVGGIDSAPYSVHLLFMLISIYVKCIT